MVYDAGQLGLDAADGLDGLDARRGAGRRRRSRAGTSSGSKIRSVGLEAVALDGEVVDALGDPQLPLGVAGLALLVDVQADDRGAVLAGEAEDPVEARALGLAVLEVGRVEDRPAADVLEAGLDAPAARWSRARAAALAWVAKRAGDLVHVDGAVAADVVDADVEDVGAFLHLLAWPSARRCPSRRRASRRGTSCEPLALVRSPIDEVRELLVERHVRVDRRRAGLVLRRARAPA